MLMLVLKLLPVHICMRQNPCAWSFPISTKCSPDRNSASLCNSPTVYVDFYQLHFADMKTESQSGTTYARTQQEGQGQD